MRIRTAEAGDAAFLWQCLAIAAQEPSAEAAGAIPGIAKYLAGWPRAGDFGVIAEIAGRAVGAAWARQFSPDERPFIHIGEKVPEIAIGVRPEFRDRGIGAALLAALSAMARGQVAGLCLNVREDNRAVGLYGRVGFVPLPGRRILNRLGTISVGMVLDLSFVQP